MLEKIKNNLQKTFFKQSLSLSVTLDWCASLLLLFTRYEVLTTQTWK